MAQHTIPSSSDPLRTVWRRPRVLSQIATIDLETDPFQAGRVPRPFAAGYYDGKEFRSFWGADCVQQLVRFLLDLKEPKLIYAHNGGHFDFHWFLPWVSQSARTFFIKTRLAAWHLGPHELRDSFCILPAALGKMGNKRSIDMARLEAGERDRHRLEIVRYMRTDCTELHALVSGFVREFGAKYTAAGAALRELKKLHPYKRMSRANDEIIREGWFHGARVECFQSAGVYPGPWRVFDVNSMYPYVMAYMRHPISHRFYVGRRVTSQTAFLTVECRSTGWCGGYDEEDEFCFPDDGELRRFNVTIHEYRTARKLGLLRACKVIETIDFPLWGDFREFVETYYGKRNAAREAGDLVMVAVYKVLLNAAYGRTGIDPAQFHATMMTHRDKRPPAVDPPWQLVEENEAAGIRIWQRPLDHERDELWRKYENVAIAASITGAARAVLLEAKVRASEPAYCDTDSLICRSLPADMLDASRLGAWKEEPGGDRLAIAGKKTYALIDRANRLVKYGCKGVALYPGTEWSVISKAARGIATTIARDAPTFSRSGEVSWMKRTISPTAKDRINLEFPLTPDEDLDSEED